jgi:hypothetical protein
MSFGMIGSAARRTLKRKLSPQEERAQQMLAVDPATAVIPPAQPPRGLIGGMSPLAREASRGGMDRMPTVSQEATKVSKKGARMRGQGNLPGPAEPINDGGFMRMFGYKPDETGQEFGEWMFSDRQTVENAKAGRAAVAAKAEAEAQYQRQYQEIVQQFGPEAGQAFKLNPEEFGKRLSERFGSNVLNQGDVLDRGIDTPDTRFAAPPKQTDANNIRQVGNQIVERQQDGSWKPVYTGSSPAETARAFQGFIDAATGEQMLVMSDGSTKGTGREAYVPKQYASFGGVPTFVDKRTNEVTELSPLSEVAGNQASIASAEVQGKAQGQVAFDLPVIEQRAQTAMSSIADLKGRDLGTRFGMQGRLYAIPGTDGADVQAVVDQVTSQAFLNAFEQLKGGGAITEREGQAATQAITRLQNQNITVGEALKAMDELDGYYRKGLDVARQRAIKAPVLPGRPGPSAGATRTREGVPFLLAKPQSRAAGIPDGVDPNDWQFMTPEQRALFQ